MSTYGASNFKEIMNVGPHKLEETDVSAHNPYDSETLKRWHWFILDIRDYLSFARMLLSGKSKSGETLLSRNMVEFMKINRIPNKASFDVGSFTIGRLWLEFDRKNYVG